MSKRLLTAALTATLAAVACPALADVGFAEDSIASDDALILQYVCVQDFHACLTAIPERAAFGESAYATEYGSCCVNATYCDVMARDAVPQDCTSDCDGEYGLGPGDDATYEPSYELELKGYVANQCGEDQATEAEARRQAWLGTYGTSDE